ncbi:MAG TPA: hypothetical protein VHB25_14275 [Gemmatimonadaceae bacterium]|nr:hypothetical protein [Gemmatimonadaceae bacterium]
MNVTDAYRADLSHAGAASFGPHDADWLVFATTVQRAAELRAPDREAYLRRAAADMVFGDRGIGTAVRAIAHAERIAESTYRAVRACATHAEEAGAFATAMSLLDCGRAIVGLSEAGLYGRLAVQQARILRKLGELDSAVRLIDETKRLAAEYTDPGLLALAHVAAGATARVRGNHPLSRAEFGAVLAIAGDDDELRELKHQAHHGMLVACAVAGDFDAALQHGAAAWELAGTDEQKLEIVLNVASVCYDSGQFREALNGYLRVLAESTLLRVRIHALGGAALAAARLNERTITNALDETARRLSSTVAFSHEVADMSREFAEAFAYLGDEERFDHYRADALRRSREHGFHEIAHRLETFRVPAPSVVAPRVLSDAGLEVASRFGAGDSRDLLALAVSSPQRSNSR